MENLGEGMGNWHYPRFLKEDTWNYLAMWSFCRAFSSR